MPMPVGGPWPPNHIAEAYKAYRDWDAWYTGNPDKLRYVYAGRGSTNPHLRPSQRTYPGQYAGGVIGRFSRWLWGAPPPVNQRDGRLHAPLPADLAAVSARLLFSEPPTLSHPDTGAQAILDRLAEDGLARKLIQGAEACSALGDVYLRPVVDRDVYPDRAIVSTVHADGAIPVIRFDKLIEVTFWQCLHQDGNQAVRLLEHHDVVNGAGRITYALFEGTPHQLGQRIPLTAYPETALLAKVADSNGMQATGLPRLDVVRIPNAGPQRLWRTHPTLKYLGRSDFDGAEQWFDAYDEVWTSLLRDIRLAKSRVLVPEYFLQSAGAGQGATFDLEREVFQSLNMLPQDERGNGITLNQFAIRVAEHLQAAEAIVRVVLRHEGISPQTFGEEGDVAATATEVQAKERMSFTTRGERIQTWKPGVAEYTELHMMVEAENFKGPEPVRPIVEFGDSVSEPMETIARTIQLLDAAGAISTYLKVKMAHQDWDESDVLKEVDRIKGEKTVENPETFTGADDPGSGEDEGEPSGGS